MKRDRATTLLEELVRRAMGEDWPVELVQAVYVFGSYARGAVEPGDVDVAVDLKRDDRWTSHSMTSMEYGRDPYAVLRQALRGHARGVSILFQRHEGHDDVPMTLLWRRGEPVDIAVDRVHAIPVDPTAGPAPRGAMLDCFEGLDRWLPRYLRQELIAFIDDEAINVEQVALDDADIADPSVRDLVEARWSVTSHLRRAARAALAHLESRGIDLRTVHLHGQHIGKPLPSYYVGFELRHLASALYCLEEHNGHEWLEVVHPTRQGSLRALRICPQNRTRLANRKRDPGSFFR
jgi:hypothetical protein